MHSRMSNGCRTAFPAPPPRLILTDLLYCLCQLQIIYKRRLVMAFTEITPEEININPFTSWSRYVLVTAGNIEKCNTLLVTWGGFGVMWRKKTATIYIRQSRFTKTILDSQDYFTLSFPRALPSAVTRSPASAAKLTRSCWNITARRKIS